jgi:hypothetical protein
LRPAAGRGNSPSPDLSLLAGDGGVDSVAETGKNCRSEAVNRRKNP